MGVTFTETIVEIWNRIIEKCRRKRHATKKGKRSKDVRKKSKNRIKDKTKEAGSSNCLQCKKTIGQEGKEMRTFWIIFTTLSVLTNLAYITNDYQRGHNPYYISNDDIGCDIHAVIYSDNGRDV